jgi:alkylated DNA repair protein alkB family protein 6
VLDLERYRVGGIDSVYYVPDYLSEAEEAQVAAQLRASPEAMWQPMHGRCVQECGSAMAAHGRGLELQRLPPWMARVCARLLHEHLFPRAMAPNSISLNEYSPFQGIAPHAVRRHAPRPRAPPHPAPPTHLRPPPPPPSPPPT